MLAGDSFVNLPDGRSLTYAEYGLAMGRPVFGLNSLPGSRLDLSAGAGPAIIAGLGLHVVAPDRRGFRGSPALRKRNHPFAADVAHLANHLKLERVAALGYSAGGPYAQACATRLRDRVGTVLAVSSVGPTSTPGFNHGLWRTERLIAELRSIGGAQLTVIRTQREQPMDVKPLDAGAQPPQGVAKPSRIDFYVGNPPRQMLIFTGSPSRSWRRRRRTWRTWYGRWWSSNWGL